MMPFAIDLFRVELSVIPVIDHSRSVVGFSYLLRLSSLSNILSISFCSFSVARFLMESNLSLVSWHWRMCWLSSVSSLHLLHMVFLSCMKEYLSSLSLVSRCCVSVFMLNASTLKFARSPLASSSIILAAVLSVAKVSIFSVSWMSMFLLMIICPACCVFSLSEMALMCCMGYCIVLMFL